MYVESRQRVKFRLFPPSLIPEKLRRNSGADTGTGRAAGTAHTSQLPTHLQSTNSVPVAGSETAADSKSATDFETRQMRAHDLAGLKHIKTAPVDLSCLRKTDEDGSFHESAPADSAQDAMANLQGITFPAADLHAVAMTYSTVGYMKAVGGVHHESPSEAARTGIQDLELHSKILTDSQNNEAKRASGAGLRRLSVELNEIVPIKRRTSAASLAHLRRRESYKASLDRLDGSEALSREDSQSCSFWNPLLDSVDAHVRNIGMSRCPPSERSTLGKLVRTYGTRVVLI